MIRLIVSDIDGTLIPYGEKTLSEELFPLIDRLKRAGILFCPASGRQLHSLRRLFAPVAEELAYVCENGAAVYGPGETERAQPLWGKTPIPRALALELCGDIAAAPGCHTLISGANVSYIHRDDVDFARRMTDYTGNLVARITDPTDIEEPILKVSAYCPEGGAQRALDSLGGRWEGRLPMAVAGPAWLDFTLADKGVGLAMLCAGLGISAEAAAAFGDNWNDLAMLEKVGQPWCMEGADPELGKRFANRCGRVEDVLKMFLDQ